MIKLALINLIYLSLSFKLEELIWIEELFEEDKNHYFMFSKNQTEIEIDHPF